MAEWIKAGEGVRYREHPVRKHGPRPDRYFQIRYTVRCERIEEALGWASEKGWTTATAGAERERLQEAQTTRADEEKAKRRGEKQRAEDEAVEARRHKTVDDLWERYSKEVVAVRNRPSTARQKKRMWETRIRPAIGKMRVRDVTDEDVGAIVRDRLRLDSMGQIASGKAEAGNVYRLLRNMFNKALIWGLRPRELGNPLTGVDAPVVARRERLLKAGEITALQKALDRATANQREAPAAAEQEEQEKARPEAPQVIAVIQLALLTGARISELLNLRHSEVRRDEMELHLPDTKIGFSRRPISKAALDVIDSVDRIPVVEYVFRAIDHLAKPLPYGTVMNAVYRIGRSAGVRFSPHVIRHWFSTMTANSVNNPRIGMALTGHKSLAAYMNYVHGDKEQARALAEQLATLVTGLGAALPNVVTLSSKKR